jgi:hypothetical protein
MAAQRRIALWLVMAALWGVSTGRVFAQDSVGARQQGPATGQQASPANQAKTANDATEPSPWLVVPVVSSNPKLGTTVGGLGAFLHKFDAESRISMFGGTYQYTSTHSTIAAVFARTSFGADHHRLAAVAAFGYIKNNYDDYLGTGAPLQTNDDLHAVIIRYLYRVKGPWVLGAQGNAANYQVIGESAEDEFVLETLGVRALSAASLGATVMHDTRDSDDMPTRGWYLNINNLAYREALGGSASFDAYRADFRAFWPHGRGHVLAVRQNNWLSINAPVIAQSTVLLRGYKLGQYLAPYMSSLEFEERLSLHRRWGATLFTGAAALYGENDSHSANNDVYPMWGAGLHFVIKPVQRMLVNFEYAQGVEDNRGVYLKFGYGW